MSFSFGQRSIDRMEGVDERLINIAHKAIKLSKVDFGIPQHGGLRTAEQQKELFLDGKSKADGYDKLSYHQSGRALDVFAYVGGQASWDKRYLTHIAAAMLQVANEEGVNLKWGGFFRNFTDMPHFEIVE